MSNQNFFFHVQQKIPCLTKKEKKFSMSKFHDQKKISCQKKKKKKNPITNIKIHTTTKIFHTHTHKNFHTYEIRLTHSNKISTLIKSEFV